LPDKPVKAVVQIAYGWAGLIRGLNSIVDHVVMTSPLLAVPAR
jgi:hypothetical protein